MRLLLYTRHRDQGVEFAHPAPAPLTKPESRDQIRGRRRLRRSWHRPAKHSIGLVLAACDVVRLSITLRTSQAASNYPDEGRLFRLHPMGVPGSWRPVCSPQSAQSFLTSGVASNDFSRGTILLPLVVLTPLSFYSVAHGGSIGEPCASPLEVISTTAAMRYSRSCHRTAERRLTLGDDFRPSARHSKHDLLVETRVESRPSGKSPNVSGLKGDRHANRLR